MTTQLKQIYEQMTPQEKKEIETFAIFLLTRRKLKKKNILRDDISIEELTQLIEESGSFDWMNSEDEDVYSVSDGEPVEWPEK